MPTHRDTTDPLIAALTLGEEKQRLAEHLAQVNGAALKAALSRFAKAARLPDLFDGRWDTVTFGWRELFRYEVRDGVWQARDLEPSETAEGMLATVAASRLGAQALQRCDEYLKYREETAWEEFGNYVMALWLNPVILGGLGCGLLAAGELVLAFFTLGVMLGLQWVVWRCRKSWKAEAIEWRGHRERRAGRSLGAAALTPDKHVA